MNKEKIKALHRKHVGPAPETVLYRDPRDAPDVYRNLEDRDATGEIIGALEPVAMPCTAPGMNLTPAQLAAWISGIGPDFDPDWQLYRTRVTL